MSGEGGGYHISGLKSVCSVAQPSVYRAVPHVHTVPPSHPAVSSDCAVVLCIGPLGKQDCLERRLEGRKEL